jgi:hypothetical protein
MRVVFAHQSVGRNILGGIRSLDPARPVRLLDDAAAPLPPGIYHIEVARNGAPHSKIEHFKQIVSRWGREADIALMKLCYVDVTRDTDIAGVFEHYGSVVADIEASLPSLRLIHVTVPLRTLRLGFRSRLRLLGGQEVEPCEDNLQREAYNELIRARFRAKSLVFDLAAIEATRDDGRLHDIRYGGRRVRSLCPAYTYDGGHLNESGARRAAARFLELCCALTPAASRPERS